VRSENLASIWLLYHLTDRMDGEEVRALAAELGLLRRADESERDYRLRIQLSGVLPTRARRAEGWFLQAKSEMRVGLGEATDPEERLALMSLLYGWGYTDERSRVGSGTPRERARAEHALDFSWRHLNERMPGCARQYSHLEKAWAEPGLFRVEEVSDLALEVSPASVAVACGSVPPGYVSAVEGMDDAQFLEQEGERPNLVPSDQMWVGDRLRYGMLKGISDGIRRRQLSDELREDPVDLYGAEVLLWQQDFRVLLALHYVEALAKRYGVSGEIPLVLSMPLGAVDLSLEQAATLYTGLLTGKRWAFPGEGVRGDLGVNASGTLLISEIRTADDRLIYKAQPEAIEVGKPVAAQQTADILHNVVAWGTGRRADAKVRTAAGVLPVGGKTGTTNQYRNAAFLGYVPRTPRRGHPELGEGPVLGVYVGYDDNRPMVLGGLRIAGASGALPAWIGMAQATASEGSEVSLTGHANLEPIEIQHAPGLKHVSVRVSDGLPEPTEASSPLVLVSRAALVSTALGEQPLEVVPPETFDEEAARALERWIRGVRSP
jgi:penicillin-binding protein 1A